MRIAFESADTRCEDRGVALVLSHTAAVPRVSPDSLAAMHRALDLAESRDVALVLTSDAEHFALGADLDAALDAAAAGRAEVLDRALERYQQTMLRLRHAGVPTIAAVRGAAVSGGCEVLMHCAHVVLHPRSAVGQLEALVGVLPGGGGVKEFALRATRSGTGLPAAIATAFDTLAGAKLARGADEAMRYGYLEPHTTTVATDFVDVAMRIGAELASTHRPPPSNPRFRVAGPSVAEQLIDGQRAALQRGELDAHQFEVNARIGSVLCGGDAAGDELAEADLLALERATFLELVATPGTQRRVAQLRAGNLAPPR